MGVGGTGLGVGALVGDRTFVGGGVAVGSETAGNWVGSWAGGAVGAGVAVGDGVDVTVIVAVGA